MRKLILSAAVALASGVICFFLSVAFLSFFLLIFWGVTHNRPDMTLTYKVAAPVGLLAALVGFIITLVRSIRSSAHENEA